MSIKGEVRMKTNQRLALVLILCLTLNLVGCKKENAKELESGITWIENEDGSYTFTNHDGNEESMNKYAWYIIDEFGEVIYKSPYSELNEFTYDLEVNENLKIKGVIRTGSDEDYVQTSQIINASEIPGRINYSVVQTNTTKTIIDTIEGKIGTDISYISAEEILSHDGSRWGVNLTLPVDWSCLNNYNLIGGYRINAFIFWMMFI